MGNRAAHVKSDLTLIHIDQSRYGLLRKAVNKIIEIAAVTHQGVTENCIAQIETWPVQLHGANWSG